MPRRTKDAWALALLVGVAGALVGACYRGLVGPAQPAPALSLAPYLDPSWIQGIESRIAGMLAPAFVTALACGLAAMAIALFCDAVVRRSLLAANPAAAVLAAALVLVAPAWGVVLMIEGHAGILAGALLAPLGCLLILEGRGARAWIGGALAILAGLAHPAWLGVAVAAVACSSRPRREGAVIAAAAVAAPLLALLVAAPESATSLPWNDRLLFAARDLASAPILAFSPWRRLDMPTGFEPVVQAVPVVAGLFLHALVLGIGMMIGGIVRGLVVAAAAAVGTFAAALLVPGWIPGDRAFVLPVVVAYAPLLGLVLCTVPQRLAKGVMPGLIVGVGAIAVLVACDRAPHFTRIGAVADIPGRRDFGREPDLARLLLYLNDVSLQDADAVVVVGAADKLAESRSPALFPERLRSILGQLTLRSAVSAPPPGRNSEEYERLLAEVTEDLVLVGRLWGRVQSNFEPVAELLVKTSPKVLDLYYNWGKEPGTWQVVQSFQRLARNVYPVAARTGAYELSLPIVEAMKFLGMDDPDTASTIAIQRTLSGDVEQGRPLLEEAIKRLPPKSPNLGLLRGLLGIVLLNAGDPKAALREIQAGWSVIGMGGVAGVALRFPVDTVDYYVIAEILLARYEAARAVDPPLAPQAARDLEQYLKGPLSFGPRRLPALAVMGKLELLRGNRDQALRFLREARLVPWQSLDDRADGPIGHISHPRYRKFALQTLLEALGDGADVAAEREEVRADLAKLAGK